MITGKSESIKIEDIDIQNYARFILKEGEGNEKRDLLGCLKKEILLKKKVVNLST